MKKETIEKENELYKEGSRKEKVIGIDCKGNISEISIEKKWFVLGG